MLLISEWNHFRDRVREFARGVGAVRDSLVAGGSLLHAGLVKKRHVAIIAETVNRFIIIL